MFKNYRLKIKRFGDLIFRFLILKLKPGKFSTFCIYMLTQDIIQNINSYSTKKTHQKKKKPKNFTLKHNLEILKIFILRNIKQYA